MMMRFTCGQVKRGIFFFRLRGNDECCCYNARMSATQKAAKTPAGENGARGVMAEQKPEESGEDKEKAAPLGCVMAILALIGFVVFVFWLLKISFIHIVWPILVIIFLAASF